MNVDVDSLLEFKMNEMVGSKLTMISISVQSYIHVYSSGEKRERQVRFHSNPALAVYGAGNGSSK